MPQSVTDNRLEQPVVEEGVTKLSPDLRGVTGRVDVVVRLTGSPTVVAAALGASAAEQSRRSASLASQQDAVVAFARSLDAGVQVLGQTRVVLNAVLLNIDSAALAGLAANASVTSIRQVADYTTDTAENAAAALATTMETVPYIGARPDVQAAADGGRGVKVAVLDSGIDYTHAAFGGAGTLAAYQAAYGTSTADPKNTTRDGLFPTARVVEGIDFVGEFWRGGTGSPPLMPDPDPIACGQSGLSTGTCDGTHGTHVADIIGGAGGVAPNVDLYAVKICSSVSTSCSGVAILQGLEYAADPNGDGNASDHVDIINMSLGSPFGQAYDDDSSLAVNNLTDLGVLTVASAGNSADRPYIVGTPSAAYRALSVAQTQVPSATLFRLRVTAPAGIAGLYSNTETVDWAPITTGFTGDVAFVGRGCPAGSVSATSPDDPYLANPAGKVALIDRGGCSISLKVDRAAKAGATAVLIGLVAAGDAVSFSYGGGDTFVQTMVIQQSLSNAIKANLNAGLVVNVALTAADAVALVGSVVGSSSRGPSIGQMFYGNSIMYGQLIKPEIGAPGASISAVAGSGTGTQAFGGTSGAAPMVSGAAALVRAYAWKTGQLATGPFEIKSTLMNTGETNIWTRPAAVGGTLAPITRIGGGEVRVDRALASQVVAYELNNRAGALSFGMYDVARTTLTLRRTVVVRNMSAKRVNLTITPTFRYAADEASGAVKVTAPASLSVPARTSAGFSERRFDVTLTIDGTKLPAWVMNSGNQGGNPAALNAMEFDGYVNLTDPANANNNVHLAWQVLPRKAADVRPSASKVVMGGQAAQPLSLQNKGVTTAFVDTYTLIGTNPFQNATGSAGLGAPAITLKGIGVATYPSACGTNNPVLQFAVSTYERRTTANYPAEFDLYMDTNQDGTPDYVVFNAENPLGSFAATGQNLTYVANLTTGAASAFFYTDHATNSGNTVLTFCGSQVGLSDANAGRLINVDAYAFDNYFTGNQSSYIEGMTMALLGERYLSLGNDIAAGATETWTVYDFGQNGSTESGLLFILDAARGSSRSGAPANNEALQIPVVP